MTICSDKKTLLASALLTGNVNTRNKLISLTQEIENLKAQSILSDDVEFGVALNNANKELEALVYASVLQWDSRSAYKPILIQKFKGWLEGVWYENMVNVLDAVDNNGVNLTTKAFKENEWFYNALGISSLEQYKWVVNDLTQSIENKMLTDYVYFGGRDIDNVFDRMKLKNKSYKALSRAIANSNDIRKAIWEVTENWASYYDLFLKNEPVDFKQGRKAVKVSELASTKNSVNNYLAFLAIINPKISLDDAYKATSLIVEWKGRWLWSIENISKIKNIDEFTNFVVSNIGYFRNNKEAIKALQDQYITISAWKNMQPSIKEIITNAKWGFDANTMRLADIINPSIISYEDSVIKKSLAELNKAWGKRLNVTTISKKLSFLDEDAGEFIQRVVKAYGENLTPEQAFDVEKIAARIADDLLNPWESGHIGSYIVEVITWKPINLDKAVFFESPVSIADGMVSEWNQTIADAYEAAYKQNSISLWKAPDSLDADAIFNKWKNGEISYVVVKNQDDYASSQIQDLMQRMSDYTKANLTIDLPFVSFHYPKQRSLVGFFIDNGELHVGTWDSSYMWTLVDSFNNANIPLNVMQVTEDLQQATIDALKVMYWEDNAYAILKLRSNLWLENIQNIKKDLDVIRSLREDMVEWYYNLADVYDSLPDNIEYFRNKAIAFAESLGINTNSIKQSELINVDAYKMKELYIGAIYGETTESIARWQDEFLQAFGIWGGSSTNATDRYYNILQRVRGQGYEIPYGDASQIMKYVDGFWDIDDKWLSSFVTRNRWKAWWLTQDSAFDILVDAKNYVDTNVVSKVPVSPTTITDETKRFFRYAPQDRVLEAKRRIANIEFEPNNSFVNLSRVKADLDAMIDDYTNSMETILREKGSISHEEADLLRRDFQQSLRVYENTLQEQYGDIIQVGQLYKHSFEAKKISDVSELDYLINNNNELKKRYGALMDNIDSRLKKKFSNSTKSLESEWYVYDTVKWKTSLYTIDDAIMWKIDDLADDIHWVEKIKLLLSSWDTNLSTKKVIWKTLKDAETMKWSTGNIQSRLYAIIDPSLKDFIRNYKVSVVDDRVLPQILHNTNATRSLWWANVLDAAQDLDIKESIFKKISDILKKWALTPEALTDIIQREVDVLYVSSPNAIASQLDLDAIRDAYYTAYMWYTRLVQLPQDILEHVANIAKKNIEYSEAEMNILKHLSIDTADWPLNLWDWARWDIDMSKPDVLYRKPSEPAVNIWAIMDDDTKKVFKNQAETVVDETIHWYDARQAWNDKFNANVFNQAKPIMDREGWRLWRFAMVHNVLKAYAEKAHFALMDGMLGWWRTKLRYYFLWWYGDSPIPVNRLNSFKEAFNDFMNLDNARFLEVDPSRLNLINSRAYTVATYAKKFQANVSNLTTNQAVNRALSSSVQDSIMKMQNVKDLEKVSTAIRNFTPFALIQNDTSLKAIAWEIVADGVPTNTTNRWILDTANRFFGSKENQAAFNTLFNTNLWLYDYRTVVAAMFGMENTGMSWMNKFIKRIWRYSTTPFMRTLYSIPWSIMVAPLSIAAYIAEYAKLSKQLGTTFGDSAWLTAWRIWNNILTQEWPDVSTLFRWLSIAMSEADSPLDAIKNLYTLTKFDDGKTVRQNLATVMNRVVDADALHTFFTQTFDNGQNIVDAIFGNTMKNMATMYGIKNNKYMAFTGFDDFTKFMNNADIPSYFKQRITDDIINKSTNMYQTIVSYGGSAMYNSIDVGRPWQSQFHRMFNLINNPINFRGSLGINTIKEVGNTLVTWLKAIGEIGRNPKKAGEVIRAVADNVHVQKLAHTIWFDALMAAKYSRLNNSWEDADDRYITLDDIKETLGLFSLPYQLAQTAGISRLINAMQGQWEYAMAAVVNQYSLNFWRQLKSLQMMTWAVRAYTTWGNDGLNNYVNNTLKTASTGAVRMFLLDRDTAAKYTFVPQNKTWMWEMWWANNEWLQLWFQMNNVKLREKMKNTLKDWKLQPWQLADVVLDVAQQTQLWKAFVDVVDSAKFWLGDKTVREKSTKNKAILENTLADNPIWKTMVENWYRYEVEKPKTDAPKSEWDAYYTKMSGVLNKITIYKWPWYISGWKFAEQEMIENFNETWTTGNEYMDNLYRQMKSDWVLDDRLYKMNNTPWNQVKDMAKQMNIELSEYIQSKPIEERPAGSDLVILSMVANAEKFAMQDAYQDQRRKDTGDKKYTLSAAEKDMVEGMVAEKYYQKYQDIRSDGTYSDWAIDLAINDIVKNNPDDYSGFVNSQEYEDDNGIKRTSYWLKSGYKEWLENLMEAQSNIINGVPVTVATISNFWPHKFFPEYAGTDKGKTATDAINLAMATYTDKWIQSRDDISMTDKNTIRVGMWKDAWLDWENEEWIRAILWDELWHNYKFSFYQAYNDWVAELNRIYDESTTAWSGKKGKAVKAPDLSKLGEGLKSMKSAISKGKWLPQTDFPRWKILSPFAYDSSATIQDRKASKGWPNFSALSNTYFKEADKEIGAKKDISRSIKSTKVTVKKATWTQKK